MDGLERELTAADSLGMFVENAVEVLGLGHELRSTPRLDARSCSCGRRGGALSPSPRGL
jgi:hypothetical protein